MITMETVEIPAPHGRLEGVLRSDSDVPRRQPYAAVVCHPHPQFQGTMHNKVVFTIAKALNAAGIPALRFNFRGVGRSTGTYGNGIGEAEDIRVALDWLAARFPATPLLLAGFSFGAWAGLPVGAADPRVQRLIGAGIPTRLLTVDQLATAHMPKLIVQGANDEYGPLAKMQSWFAALPDPKELHIVPGSSHFFTDHLDELATTITGWMRK